MNMDMEVDNAAKILKMIIKVNETRYIGLRPRLSQKDDHWIRQPRHPNSVEELTNSGKNPNASIYTPTEKVVVDMVVFSSSVILLRDAAFISGTQYLSIATNAI